MSGNAHAGRTVIVTGASSGIGRGIAQCFAKEGADIVVADVQREPRQGVHYDTDVSRPTDVWVTEETESDARFVETDVSDPTAVEAMIDTTVEEFGGIDVLVNNAGIYIDATSQEITLEEWDRVMGVNLDGVFFCSKFAIPHLIERGGTIISIGSVHASQGGGGPPYASSKAAIRNLTRDLAVELGPQGVRVVAINPGFIETPIQDYLTEAQIEAAAEHTLTTYFGTPEDIGHAATFLASEKARFIHGEALHVDGGWTAHRF